MSGGSGDTHGPRLQGTIRIGGRAKPPPRRRLDACIGAYTIIKAMEQQSLIPEIEFEQKPVTAPNGGNGRPHGATAVRRRALEQMILQAAPSVTRKVIEMALDGDIVAAKLIMERAYPKPKSAPIDTGITETSTTAEIRAAMRDLLRKVTAGEIPAEDGNYIITTMRHVLEADRVQAIDLMPTLAQPASSAREELARRLQKQIEARAQKQESGETA